MTLLLGPLDLRTIVFCLLRAGPSASTDEGLTISWTSLNFALHDDTFSGLDVDATISNSASKSVITDKLHLVLPSDVEGLLGRSALGAEGGNSHVGVDVEDSLLADASLGVGPAALDGVLAGDVEAGGLLDHTVVGVGHLQVQMGMGDTSASRDRTALTNFGCVVGE